MRGTLRFDGHEIPFVHLSAGVVDGELVFSNFQYEEDDYEEILVLKEYRLFVPGDGTLRFSGYAHADQDSYRLMEVEFFPAGYGNVLIHDLYSHKRGTPAKV